MSKKQWEWFGDWFDHDANKKKLWIALIALCVLSVVGEFFIDRELHTGDWGLGFYAVLGFTACAVSIFIAKALGLVLKVNEDFYGEAEAPGHVEQEDHNVS